MNSKNKQNLVSGTNQIIKNDLLDNRGLSNNNIKNGYNIRSSYWKNYKLSLPDKLPTELFEICVGIILGDGTLYRTPKGAKIKFEYGYMHKDYLFSILNLFQNWTFYELDNPYIRINKNGTIKSYYSFRTFSHTAFIPLYDLFMVSGKKTIRPNLIKNHLSLIGLAYWIADDGSYNKKDKSLVLNSQSFSESENRMMSCEINDKFKLNSTIRKHRKKDKMYWVIHFPPKDVITLQSLLTMPYSMGHKLGANYQNS